MILVQKKGIYAISRKVFLFTEKENFSISFCLFYCFHKKINKKQWILRQYTFFLKILYMTCFSTFLEILTLFYTKTRFTSIGYAICIKTKFRPKKWLFQCFCLIFICWWKKTKKYIYFLRQYFFSLKFHKLHIFMFLSLFYDNIFSSLKLHNWLFFSMYDWKWRKKQETY